jgi:hypothetical protein
MSEAFETNPSHNPFGDLSALRLDQSYADTVGVKKLLTTVPVRKPNGQDFVRVHRDPRYRLTPAAIIEVKEDREVCLVTPIMGQALPGEFALATLFTTINRQGTLHVRTAETVSEPHGSAKADELKRPEAISPQAATSMFAVCDGRTCIGHLLLRGKVGVEAVDVNDRSLGLFPDTKTAAAAVSARAHRTAQ